jgi:hypothetical protein
VCRSKADAPEIDGVVYVVAGRDLKEGEILSVAITGGDGHELVGETAN